MYVGPPQSGKKEALFAHLLAYYGNDPAELKRRTLVVNCITDQPGANFVSDVLRPFASAATSSFLRSVVFLYADHLGLDAQTSLRRCMELCSSTTRFFLVLYADGALIAPIRSRLGTRKFVPATVAADGADGADASDAAVPRPHGEDAVDALEMLEREICVNQATWSGLGRLFHRPPPGVDDADHRHRTEG